MLMLKISHIGGEILKKSVFVYFCLSTFSISVSAQKFMVEGLCYEIIDSSHSTCRVVKKEPLYSGDIFVPSSVNYKGRRYKVVEIGKEAFALSNIRRITIPNSLKSIGDYAFWGTDIDTLSIPGSVISIGESCFRGCHFNALTICNGLPAIKLGSGSFIDAVAENLYWGRNTDYYAGHAFDAEGYNFPLVFKEVHSLIIGDDVTSVEMNMHNIKQFKAGKKLKKLPLDILNASDLILISLSKPIGTGSFNDKVYANATLIIPHGTIKEFERHPTWRNFHNILEEKEQEQSEDVKPIDNDLIESNVKSNNKQTFDILEEMPQYPGGPAALFSFLVNNIKYPVVAEENGVQGRVIASFTVEKDGSLTDIKIVKSVDPSLDKEAQRVIRAMPRWIPGKVNGSPVRVKYTVPLTFRLQ